MVVVLKKNDEVRLRRDPRLLNKALETKNFPIHAIEHFLPELSKAWISIVAGANGFWQIEID